jgi:hypothetical protein
MPNTEYFLPKPSYAEEIYIQNREGYKLHAWYSNTDSSKTVLFCHGNAGNLTFRLDIMDKFKELGISVLMFDYMGFGKSTGKTLIESTYNDTVDCMEYLVKEKNVNINDIVPIGESIGSFPASKCASVHDLPKLIIFAGFHSISDAILDIFPKPFNFVCSFICYGDLDTGKYLKKFKGKSLLFHSKEDKIVSYRNALKNSTYGGTLIDIKGTHNDLEIDWDIVKEFILN